MQSSQASDQEKLAAAYRELRTDPLGFVYFNYPWGVEGSALENEEGPDEWQTAELIAIGEHIKSGNTLPYQSATSSGHGIGKGTLCAWIVQWFMSCFPHNPQAVVTANTKTQLEKKTWRELAKWWHMSRNKTWFHWTATKYFFKGRPDSWFAVAQSWNKDNAEAFAGTHEESVLMIFDEASGIPQQIWDVAEGAMTTRNCFWFVFGNPTRNTGAFRECFGKNRHRWRTNKIDSRACKKAGKEKIRQWVEDYGEDSDFVRIRVRGEFPRSGSNQFISNEIMEAAQEREATGYSGSAKILGVDVARFGDNQSVLTIRQGYKVFPSDKYREKDTIQLAGLIAEKMDKEEPDATFIDATGIGWGVVDQLTHMGYRVFAVEVGQKADDPNQYFNKRIECWDRYREWLSEGGDVPADDKELFEDSIGPEYGFDNKMRLQLEKKEDMSSRGIASPDTAESIIMTFARRISPTVRDEELDDDEFERENSWMGR
jgi:hypothetical protein